MTDDEQQGTPSGWQPPVPPPPPPYGVPPEYGANPGYGTPQAYGGPQPYGTPPPAYGSTPGQFPATGYGGFPGQGYGPPPNNYLVWAILSTVLCCLPAGIVSIVYSSQVSSKWAVGDVAGAQRASNNARIWAIVSAASLAGLLLVYLVIAGISLSLNRG